VTFGEHVGCVRVFLEYSSKQVPTSTRCCGHHGTVRYWKTRREIKSLFSLGVTRNFHTILVFVKWYSTWLFRLRPESIRKKKWKRFHDRPLLMLVLYSFMDAVEIIRTRKWHGHVIFVNQLRVEMRFDQRGDATFCNAGVMRTRRWAGRKKKS
jgi:hypothetical protein